jgi:hypothetical protein
MQLEVHIFGISLSFYAHFLEIAHHITAPNGLHQARSVAERRRLMYGLASHSPTWILKQFNK